MKFDLNHIMKSFTEIASFIRKHTLEEINEGIASLCKISPEQLAHCPMGGYSKGGTSGAYKYVIADMKKNITHYEWVFNHLADEKSREVFTNLMRFRIVPDMQFIRQAYDKTYPQYFDNDILRTDENEVFVDCGGFTGDTVQSYLKHCGKYKHIYVFEPSGDNVKLCHENLDSFPDIDIIPAGVGRKRNVLELHGSGSAGSFTNIGVSGDGEQIRITSLDEEIAEAVTFIKMDIECFEVDGILGAKQHIRNDNPKLAICLYHVLSDIWEIPRLIHAINPNYQYYIRHYEPNQNWETVLYAIPLNDAEERGKLPQKKNLGVYVPSAFEMSWVNQQLLKDCGLVPYMFHKLYGYDVTMLGVRHGEYPYLEKYLSGMRMEFLPNCQDDNAVLHAQLRYISKYYKMMDILILHGPYPVYQYLIPEYRKLRPDGKIYLALDANSGWMDRIDWTAPEFSGLLDACDVIGASCRKIQEHLNRKWFRWRIEYIPNGFFNASGHEIMVLPEDKENVILTVARIGTQQKANHILLEAFARISSKIPDWKVYLVGDIDQSFQPYIDDYFSKYPHLRERVLFKGIIESKEELYKEYKRAKVFALTSLWEGAPNVVAEALHHGCYMITSDIDAALDITKDNTLGKTFPIGDIGALSDILEEVCSNGTMLSECIPDILSYARNTFAWEPIVRRLHHLLFEV